jgi:hypothetical protein
MIPAAQRAPLCLAAALLAGCNEDALLLPPPATHADAAAPAPSAAVLEPPSPTGNDHFAARSPDTTGNDHFAVVARSPDTFELYPLQGALFVDAAGFLAILGDAPLRQSPALMKGLEKGASGHLWGAWPGAAWLSAGDTTYHHVEGRWVEEKLLHEHETLLAITSWGAGALAAIAAPGNDMRFVLTGQEGETAGARETRPGAPRATSHDGDGARAQEARPATLPLPSPADPRQNGAAGEGVESDETEVPCKVRMKPRAVVLAALPGGQLYAAGYTCEPMGHGDAIVERWGPGQVHGAVDPLPRPESGSNPAPRGVLARSPGEVMVYGSEGVAAAPYLARFDGASWSLEAAPFGGAVETLAAADDGTLWAAAGGAVWKRAASEAWEKVPLPGGLVAHAAWPRGADVWVAARQTEGKHRAVLLRTARGPAPELMRLPPRNAMAGALASGKHFFATAACDKVFVEISVLGPSKDPATGKPAAVPKKFASLDAILTGDLAGFAPVVDDDGDHLHLGVPVPSRDVGRRLAAAYQDQNPGSSPTLSCYEPAGKPATGAGAAPPRGGRPSAGTLPSPRPR